MLESQIQNRLDARLEKLLQLAQGDPGYGDVAACVAKILDDMSATEFEKYGRKLLRKGWRKTWDRHGNVNWSWFGDIDHDGNAKALYDVFTELVRFLLSSPTPQDKEINTNRLGTELTKYLQLHGYDVPVWRGETGRTETAQKQKPDGPKSLGLLTEPMTISRLASYFGVNRNKMSEMLNNMDGVEKPGGLYRVPISQMPPKYHLEKGLMPPR